MHLRDTIDVTIGPIGVPLKHGPLVRPMKRLITSPSPSPSGRKSSVEEEQPAKWQAIHKYVILCHSEAISLDTVPLWTLTCQVVLSSYHYDSATRMEDQKYVMGKQASIGRKSNAKRQHSLPINHASSLCFLLTKSFGPQANRVDNVFGTTCAHKIWSKAILKA